MLLALAQTQTALRHASAADVAKQHINYSSVNQFQPPAAPRVLLLTLESCTLLSEELKEQLKMSNLHLLIQIFLIVKHVSLFPPSFGKQTGPGRQMGFNLETDNRLC